MSITGLIWEWMAIAAMMAQITYWRSRGRPDLTEHTKTWLFLPAWGALMWLSIFAYLVLYCKRPIKKRLHYYFWSFVKELIPD